MVVGEEGEGFIEEEAEEEGGENTIVAPATAERNMEVAVEREIEVVGIFIVEGVWQGAGLNLGIQKEGMCTHKVGGRGL